MEEPNDLKHALEQLRWILSGLQMSGLESWLARPRAPKATREEETVQAKVLETPDTADSLSRIRDDLGECTRCRLHATRTNIVFGEGSPDAPLVFVGEGPGFDEDRQGRPFVGRAGRLLDKMIRAMGLRREEVYICNVVKCRPPKNRTPDPDEIATCSPFLIRQLEAIHPTVICALGASAAQTLLDSTQSISGLRGKAHLWRGIPLVATFHPAYLLRNSMQKASVWRDLLEVHKLLG